VVCFSSDVISSPSDFFVGDDLIHAVQDIQSDLPKDVSVYVQGSSVADLPPGFISLQDLTNECSAENVSRTYRKLLGPRDPFCYIYTSGTTGMHLDCHCIESFSLLYFFFRAAKSSYRHTG
jgi:acyl-coenzyme A synthetase/AMP-(fatty) acid ligase